MSERAIERRFRREACEDRQGQSLREQIYENLRERIHAGQFTFDDRLVDVDIANEFGVSRMPVREALMQLVHDGMIESTSRGFVLRRYSDQEIEEIFEIRRLLEPAAAAIAAKKMTDAALEEMDERDPGRHQGQRRRRFRGLRGGECGISQGLDGAGSECAAGRGAGALHRSRADHPPGDAVAAAGPRGCAGAAACDPRGISRPARPTASARCSSSMSMRRCWPIGPIGT